MSEWRTCLRICLFDMSCYMVVEIEYFKGDTLLYGSKIPFEEFERQVRTIEKLCDGNEDNFVALLCRIYNWTVIEDSLMSRYIYDRDTKKCIRIQ